MARQTAVPHGLVLKNIILVVVVVLVTDIAYTAF